MAAANLIARFESKMTAALGAHDAKLDAMRSELNVQRWLMRPS